MYGQKKILRYFGTLSALAGMLLICAGCESSHRVLGSWHEEVTNRESTTINKCPSLKPPGLLIQGRHVFAAIQQESILHTDIRHMEVSYKAVRYADKEYVQKHNKLVTNGVIARTIAYPVGTAVTLGLGVIVIPGMIHDDLAPARKSQAKDKECLKRLKDGEATSIDEGKNVWYKREEVGMKCVSVEQESHSLGMSPASKKRLSLVLSDGTMLKEATSDKNGFAFFLLDPETASRVKETDSFVAQIHWEDMWVDIGRRTLSMGHCRALQAGDRMEHTGTPRGVPIVNARPSLIYLSEAPIGVIMLKLTVSNVGTGSFFGLVGQTECEIQEFNGLIFEIGKLGVGEFLTLVSDIQVPKQCPQIIPVTFKWKEKNGNAPDPITSELRLPSDMPRQKTRIKAP